MKFIAPLPYTVVLNLEINERPCLNFSLHITYIRGYMPSRHLRRLDTPLRLYIILESGIIEQNHSSLLSEAVYTHTHYGIAEGKGTS